MKKTRQILKDTFATTDAFAVLEPVDFGHLLDSVHVLESDGPSGVKFPDNAPGPTSAGPTGEFRYHDGYLYLAYKKDQWIRFGPGATSW